MIAEQAMPLNTRRSSLTSRAELSGRLLHQWTSVIVNMDLVGHLGDLGVLILLGALIGEIGGGEACCLRRS